MNELTPAQCKLVMMEEFHRALDSLRGGVGLSTRKFAEVAADTSGQDYLIKGIMDRGSVVMMAGYTGTFKTFIAIDMGCRVALGQTWMDNRVHQTNVLYVVAEGTAGWRKRARAWMLVNNSPDVPMEVIECPVQLADDAQMAELMAKVDHLGAGLVIIDTMARCSVGLEENAAKDMGTFLDRLYLLRDACTPSGTTVMLVHHTGYDKTRLRGSSAIQSAMDESIIIEGDAAGITFTSSKRKDYGLAGDLFLNLDVVNLGTDADGDPITSCVISKGTGLPQVPSHGAQILAQLRIQPHQNQGDLMTSTSLSQSQVSKAAKELVSSGLLDKVNCPQVRGKCHHLT